MLVGATLHHMTPPFHIIRVPLIPRDPIFSHRLYWLVPPPPRPEHHPHTTPRQIVHEPKKAGQNTTPPMPIQNESG